VRIPCRRRATSAPLCHYIAVLVTSLCVLYFRSVRKVQLHLLSRGHSGPTRQVHRVSRIRPLLAGGSTVRTTILDHVDSFAFPFSLALTFLFFFALFLPVSHVFFFSVFFPSVCFFPYFILSIASTPAYYISLCFHISRFHFSPSLPLFHHLLFYSRTYE